MSHSGAGSSMSLGVALSQRNEAYVTSPSSIIQLHHIRSRSSESGVLAKPATRHRSFTMHSSHHHRQCQRNHAFSTNRTTCIASAGYHATEFL